MARPRRAPSKTSSRSTRPTRARTDDLDDPFVDGPLPSFPLPPESEASFDLVPTKATDEMDVYQAANVEAAVEIEVDEVYPSANGSMAITDMSPHPPGHAGPDL